VVEETRSERSLPGTAAAREERRIPDHPAVAARRPIIRPWRRVENGDRAIVWALGSGHPASMSEDGMFVKMIRLYKVAHVVFVSS
jgi:hypothetical protein